MMERLPFDGSVKYDALEAAIHLNRYGFVRPFVQGKRVLDMAAGEGYGSFLMAHWGASSVVGVDLCEDTMRQASHRFQAPSLSFTVHDGQRLLERFEPQSLDLIVSLETFEHLPRPELALSAFKELLAPGGIIVISCPNDHWYYKNVDEQNPFHARKYHFEEFSSITREMLGDSASFYLGSPASGFMHVPMRESSLVAGTDFDGELRNPQSMTGAYFVPPTEPIAPETCSYFLGVWGASEPAFGNAAIFPCSMDSHLLAPRYFDTAYLSDEVKALRTKVFDLNAALRVAELRADENRVVQTIVPTEVAAPAPPVGEHPADRLEKVKRTAVMRQMALAGENEALLQSLRDREIALLQKSEELESAKESLNEIRLSFASQKAAHDELSKEVGSLLQKSAEERERLSDEASREREHVATAEARVVQSNERVANAERELTEARQRFSETEREYHAVTGSLKNRIEELKTPLGLIRAIGGRLFRKIPRIGRTSESMI